MPKSTDMTGTFRIPEDAWGRFWNFMLTIDGADIAPNTRATPKGERKRSGGSTAEGTTGRCIMLTALAKRSPQSTKEISALLVEAGKSAKSVSNAVFDAKNAKLIKSMGKATYAITPAGKAFLKENCKGKT